MNFFAKIVDLFSKRAVLQNPPNPSWLRACTLVTNNLTGTLDFFSKDEWDTKRTPSKSMKNALYQEYYTLDCTYCGMPKGMWLAEATLNSEKINPVSLAIIKLCLSVSQAVSQSVENFF